MKHYILKNVFTAEEREMIHFCVRGMYLANRSEVHSAQNTGAFGAFCDCLWRIITVAYSEDASQYLRDRFDYDQTDADEFFEWFDDLVKEDAREIADMLSGATIQI